MTADRKSEPYDEATREHIRARFADSILKACRVCPGLIGKKSRIRSLVRILEETLAFDAPFGEMAESLELENMQDDAFERILPKFEIPEDYPVRLAHFTPATRARLEAAGAGSLAEAIHVGQNSGGAEGLADPNNFVNGLAHKDEVGIARHIPFRPGSRGLHLAEAIGLVAGELSLAARQLLLEGGAVSAGSVTGGGSGWRRPSGR